MTGYYDEDHTKDKEINALFRRVVKGGKTLTPLKKKVKEEEPETLGELEQRVKDRVEHDRLSKIRKELINNKKGSDMLRGLVKNLGQGQSIRVGVRKIGSNKTEKVDGVMIANKHVDREVLNEND